LLHVDVARLARFERPGHAVTGIRDKTGAEKRARRGYVYLHCVVDDRSRYAHVEQHRDQSGETAAAVLGRAIEHFASLGMQRPEAVMSDNAFAYRNAKAFGSVLAT
jgi:transposase InsO family protein